MRHASQRCAKSWPTTSVDAIWFARGGYGSNRIAEAAARDLPAAARSKTYLGYSDAGFLLAAFHKSGLNVAHGPMVQDVARDGGEAAIHRALDWLVRRDESALEPGLSRGRRAMAFNLTVLSHLLGTAIEPDFTGAELLIEDVAEHEYRIDRTMFHVTGSAGDPPRRAEFGWAGSAKFPTMTRVRAATPNPSSATGANGPESPFGGHADIGHDAANRVVPFNYRAN